MFPTVYKIKYRFSCYIFGIIKNLILGMARRGADVVDSNLD